MMSKTKQEWLFQLRKCTCQATLDKVIEKNNDELAEDELVNFLRSSRPSTGGDNNEHPV